MNVTSLAVSWTALSCNSSSCASVHATVCGPRWSSFCLRRSGFCLRGADVACAWYSGIIVVLMVSGGLTMPATVFFFRQAYYPLGAAYRSHRNAGEQVARMRLRRSAAAHDKRRFIVRLRWSEMYSRVATAAAARRSRPPGAQMSPKLTRGERPRAGLALGTLKRWSGVLKAGACASPSARCACAGE